MNEAYEWDGTGKEHIKKLFDAFIETKGKKPIQKFGNTPRSELPRFEDVYDVPEFAGLIRKGYLCVDVDDSKMADTLYKMVTDMNMHTLVINTTRGKHFYFKNDGTIKKQFGSIYSVCGIKADIKMDNNQLCVLKQDNKFREIVHDNVQEDFDYIPVWLKPFDKTNRKLFMMEEGARNNELFSYGMELRRSNLLASCSNNDIRNIAKLINKYVFAKPLPDKEIDDSLSDSQFTKYAEINDKTDGQGRIIVKIASETIAKYHVRSYGGRIYYYINGSYKQESKAILREVLTDFPTFNKSKTNIANLRSNIEYSAKDIQPAPSNYILFQNGILDIDKMELLPQSPDFFIPNLIPHNYNPNAYDDVFDKFLDDISCKQKEVRSVLEECMGECLYRSYNHSKIFFMHGNGSNGKTTFLEILRCMLGAENCSSSSLEQLCSRFGGGELVGKLANLSDEISNQTPNRIQILKHLSGDGVISVELKGQNEKIQFTNNAKLFFFGNELPLLPLKKAERRRYVFIPFNASFEGRKKDINLRDKLCIEQAIEYAITLAIEGLRRIIGNNGELTECKILKQDVEDYERKHNTIYRFFSEVGINKILEHTADEVKSLYDDFCERNDLYKFSKIKLNKNLKEHLCLDLPVVSGNKRVFKPADGYTGEWKNM